MENSPKEQFSLSRSPKRTRRVADGPTLDHTHPPLLPAGSSGWFESIIKGPTHAPFAQTWNQVSVAPHTQTTFWSTNELPEPGPCIPPRYPTAGTLVVPLVPLIRYLGAWLALLSTSRWLLRTIRLGYAIQFAQLPHKFRGIHFTPVKAADAHVLCAEITVLLARDAIEPIPPAGMKTGFYSPYFIVPKKGGGLRLILDLCVLCLCAFHRLPFKMLTQNRIFGCIHPRD